MSDSTRHKWGERDPLQNRTLRHCQRCGLVRVTRHEPNERPWIEWWRDGVRINSELTPMCDGRFDAAGKAVAGTLLLQTMALGGKTGMKLADVIVGLVRQGVPLGSFDKVEREQPDGSIKEVAAYPQALLARVQQALDAGDFEWLTAKEIVDRLLIPPLAEAAE